MLGFACKANKDRFNSDNGLLGVVMALTGEAKREYQRNWLKARRAKAVEALGGSCVKCGGDDRLEFDHIDPTLKSYSVSRLWSRSWTAIWSEVAKCQLLCFTCHKSKTKEGAHKQFCPQGHDTHIVGRKSSSGNGCRECAQIYDREVRIR